MAELAELSSNVSGVIQKPFFCRAFVELKIPEFNSALHVLFMEAMSSSAHLGASAALTFLYILYQCFTSNERIGKFTGGAVTALQQQRN